MFFLIFIGLFGVAAKNDIKLTLKEDFVRSIKRAESNIHFMQQAYK